MITVRTPSRLHFGLLGLEDYSPWADREGEARLPGRAFGGVGLMVQEPGVQLRLTPAPAWGAEGPLAARALAFAEDYAAAVRRDQRDRAGPPQHFVVERAAPEHAGLGTGTQLGLAVARGLAGAWGIDEPTAVLARRVGRGLRSAVGVHGFERGGFLVEAGKRSAGELSPLVAHASFPEDWRVLLVLPSQYTGLYGQPELEAFRRLARQPPRRQTEALCRLVLQGLLPAVLERDVATFGEVLYDFNARSGELFAPVQGGVYGSPAVAEIISFARALGILGVGQSSWGPAVFAVAEDEERAARLSEHIRQRFGQTGVEVVITRAWNRGALVS
jgi:beta-ribofuranosylaminobenzene 5'-phosphate synthase